MRATALLAGMLILGSGNAEAFECRDLSLPSRLVICSDPELVKLATERQKAFDQALARLDGAQRKELLADQQEWAKLYATECDIPPNKPPPNPVPPTVKACFKRAAEARLAYIEAYGSPGGTAATGSALTPKDSRPEPPAPRPETPATQQPITPSSPSPATTLTSVDPRTDNITVAVTGTGPTADEARMDAIRQALQQTITQLVVVDRAIRNDRIVRDNILSTMNGYVEKFTAVKTVRSSAGFEIEAEIVVSASRIENFIGVATNFGTPIEGSSLLAESDRELAQRKARGEIFDRTLREFPADATEIQIASVKPSDSDPNLLVVQFSLSYKPTFVKAFTETARALSSAICDVDPRIYSVLTVGGLIRVPNPERVGCSREQLALAQQQPSVCIFYSTRAACFILQFGDYCRKCAPGKNLSFQELVVAYTFVDDQGISVLSDGAKCRQARVWSSPGHAQSARTFLTEIRADGAHPPVFTAGFDVGRVQAEFFVPKSAVNLEKAKYVVAVTGIAGPQGDARPPIFHLIKEDAGIMVDACSVLDAAIERAVLQKPTGGATNEKKFSINRPSGITSWTRRGFKLGRGGHRQERRVYDMGGWRRWRGNRMECERVGEAHLFQVWNARRVRRSPWDQYGADHRRGEG